MEKTLEIIIADVKEGIAKQIESECSLNLSGELFTCEHCLQSAKLVREFDASQLL